MSFELVPAAVIGTIVLLGLAFREPVIERIAALDTDAELLDPDDIE